MDPAAGSGNFLTETYICLRRLENEILKELYGFQIVMGQTHNPIKVSIGQFYGIEINDFAVSVARTALWIAESQMMKETEDIVNMKLSFLPLKSYPNIVEGNALTIDWEGVVPKNELNYIMGNPPFVGTAYQSENQKNDVKNIFKGVKKSGKLDYVACWYKKSAEYIQSSNIEVALVSTNSIVQGDQVSILWDDLFNNHSIKINFVYKTFVWESEASEKAKVHVVIIGFSNNNRPEKFIYDGARVKKANNINGYLVDGPNISIMSSSTPLTENVPVIRRGLDPVEGGNLIFTEEEKNEFLIKNPNAEKFFRQFMMGKDFIDRKPRYCLWLKDKDIREIRSNSAIMDRVKKVKEFRLNSKSEQTRRAADTPTLFYRNNDLKSDFIALPKVSSEKRKYIPVDYLSKNIIPGDNLFVSEDAEIYHFGIITSNVHNSWMRVVAGRLKSDFRYSNTMVYNTFPWPNPTKEQRERIEKTAQMILDARNLYPDSSLADLYDDLTMPPELRKAHQENDKAVMEAYGFDWRKMTESECVAELMKLYQKLTK